MTVAQGKTVSIEYTLRLEDDKVIDTNVGEQPLTYVQGQKQIIPGLEAALEGMKVGDTKKVTVQPEDAYGPVIPEAILKVGKDKMPEELFQVGANVQAQGSQGQVLRGKVTEIEGDMATIDFNHPLAGKVLFFDVKIIDIQ